MKLWEVLKALEENPEKKFETDLGGFRGIFRIKGGYFRLDVYNNGKLIPQELGGGAFNDNIRLGKDWEEVKQSVTWQEAIEAWVNGKTIKCTSRGANFVFEGYKPRLRDQLDTIDRAQLQDGTWYIEE